MPKAVEDCVKKVSGTNKKTGKPYTQSEKWAICTAAHKKEKSELDVVDEVMAALTFCREKLISLNKVANEQEAVAMTESLLAKAEHDVDLLKFVLDKV